MPIQYTEIRSHEMRGRTPFIRTSAEEFVQTEVIVQRYSYLTVRYGDDLGEEHDLQLRKESRD